MRIALVATGYIVLGALITLAVFLFVLTLGAMLLRSTQQCAPAMWRGHQVGTVCQTAPRIENWMHPVVPFEIHTGSGVHS